VDILFYLLIAIGKAIYKAIQKRKGTAEANAPGAGARAGKPQSGASARPTVDPRLASALARELGRMVALAESAGELDTRLSALATRYRKLGTRGNVFIEVIDKRLRPSIAEAEVEVRKGLATLSSQGPIDAIHTLRNDHTLGHAVGVLEAAGTRTQLLEVMADWREDPRTGFMLADADAIAAAIFEPAQAFARTHGLDFPTQRPIAAPASGAESLWIGLLPPGYPVIFVPDDFDRDLYRQASVPHEIGHLLWFQVAGLADEMTEVADIGAEPTLLGFEGGRVTGTLHQPFTAWLPEIAADAMAMLLMGPAALRGMLHTFAEPGAPDSVLTAGATSDGTYAPHPPAQLRVHMAAWMLHRSGFHREAEALVGEWQSLHGDPDTVILPCQGGKRVRINQKVFLDFITPRLEAWVMGEYTAFAGHRIESVPGLVMTASLWSRVKSRADDLISGTAFNDNGRIALAAAIEAQAKAPERHARIATGLRAAVLGRDAGERHAADRHYNRKKAGGTRHRLADEVRDALLLREFLGTPAFRGRRKPGART
jgi:hypothetical protein